MSADGFKYDLTYRFRDGAPKGPAFRYGESPKAVNPTIQNLRPVGSGIGPQDRVHLEIRLPTSGGTLTRMIVFVEFPALGTTAVIWDGDKFTANYTGASAMADISGAGETRIGFDVIFNGGWPSSPRVFAHANTDRGGMTVS